MRERARLKQALLYSRCRRIALAIGHRLAGSGVLQDPNDIFFFTSWGTRRFPERLRDVSRRHAHRCPVPTGKSDQRSRATRAGYVHASGRRLFPRRGQQCRRLRDLEDPVRGNAWDGRLRRQGHGARDCPGNHSRRTPTSSGGHSRYTPDRSRLGAGIPLDSRTRD